MDDRELKSVLYSAFNDFIANRVKGNSEDFVGLEEDLVAVGVAELLNESTAYISKAMLPLPIVERNNARAAEGCIYVNIQMFRPKDVWEIDDEAGYNPGRTQNISSRKHGHRHGRFWSVDVCIWAFETPAIAKQLERHLLNGRFHAFRKISAANRPLENLQYLTLQEIRGHVEAAIEELGLTATRRQFLVDQIPSIGMAVIAQDARERARALVAVE